MLPADVFYNKLVYNFKYILSVFKKKKIETMGTLTFVINYKTLIKSHDMCKGGVAHTSTEFTE